MENNEITLQKPAFWRVLVAFLLDSVLLYGIMFVFSWGVTFVGGKVIVGFDSRNIVIFAMFLGIMHTCFLFSPCLYYVILETLKGASLGKKVVSLYVKPHSFGRILGAYLIDFVCVILCSLLLYGIYLNNLGPVGVVFLPLCLGIDFIMIEGISGASLGKWICGVRVYQKLK